MLRAKIPTGAAEWHGRYAIPRRDESLTCWVAAQQWEFRETKTGATCGGDVRIRRLGSDGYVPSRRVRDNAGGAICTRSAYFDTGKRVRVPVPRRADCLAPVRE